MIKYIVSAMLFIGVAHIKAQNCDQSLSGKVIDFHDGIPLSGATISFNDQIVVTDTDGSFDIKELCPTNYAFTVSHEDCNSQVVLVDMGQVSTKNFYLEHHLNELQEVTITKNNFEKTLSAQEQTLSQDILENYSSASLGDALKEIVGVSSLNTGSTIVKPVIQGLYGSRVLIINNGVRMQDMEWGDEHAPNVDINTAGKITVVKGASALKYGGDAIGGTVILEPGKIPAIDTLFGKVVMTGHTNGRGGSLTSQLIKGYEDGWFFKAQGTLKRFGDFKAPEYILSNTGIYERSISAAFGVNKFTYGWDAYYSLFKNEIGVLAASHVGNRRSLLESINNSQPDIIRDFTYEIDNPKQDVTHHLGRLRYFKRFEELGKWTTQYDFQYNQRFEFDVRRTAELRKKPSLDLELTTHTVTTDFKFDAKSAYNFNIGLMGRYQNNFADPDTGVRRLIPDYDKYDAGVFITGEYDIDQNTSLEAGVRYDYNYINAKKFYQNSRWEERNYQEDFSDIIIDDNVSGSQLLTNPIFDYHSISGTIGVLYNFKEDYELRANYALAQRAPNPSELFSDGLHHSSARIEVGDLRIEQETSNKLSVSLQKNSEKFGWEIAPFANLVGGFILLEPVGATFTIRGDFPVWNYRQTDAQLFGIDAQGYVNWQSNWSTSHRFSLIKGYEDNDRPLINMPAANTVNTIKFEKPEWSNFKFSLESQYHFRQNEVPPNFTIFLPDTNEELTLEINTPPDAYHLLNLDMSIEFPVKNSNTLQLGFAISNLMDTSYRNYLNRQRFFADDLGRNFSARILINF